jgi:hypothetical protein
MKRRKEVCLYLLSRYTSSNDGKSVYASLLVWPNNSSEVALGAPVTSAETVVTLLGSDLSSLKWHAAGTTGGIIIDLSTIKENSLASDWTWVFKLQNLTNQNKKYRN